MSHFVVDTNVPIVANGKSNQASLTCVLTCAKKLQEIQNNHLLVLDDKWLIINTMVASDSETLASTRASP